jgi:hypothetical protein
MTYTRIATAVAMLEMARRSPDPLARAQILAETEYQVAWALREAVADCQDAGRSWADIGGAVGLPRETVFRQFGAGGPVVTVRPSQSADSPLSARQPRTEARSGEDALYAFRTEDGAWFGPWEQLLDGKFGTGWLAFDPPNEPGSRFSGQELLVRYGPWEGDVSFHAAQIREEGSGILRRVRVTYEVIDLLFGDAQTALRQAMTAVAQAAAGNPLVDPKLRALIDRATTAQGLDVSVADFVAAAEQVAGSAPLGYSSGARLSRGLQWLERAVRQYRAWAARASAA